MNFFSSTIVVASIAVSGSLAAPFCSWGGKLSQEMFSPPHTLGNAWFSFNGLLPSVPTRLANLENKQMKNPPCSSTTQPTVHGRENLQLGLFHDEMWC